jgi:hypothetical protein
MVKKTRQQGNPALKDWHSAFAESLCAELGRHRRSFSIKREFHLTAKPLVIDMLVTKEDRTAAVGKNFAQNFRTYNIIEYKSPGSYVSIADFHKVYAYALLYSVLYGKDLRDISITFAENRYPRKRESLSARSVGLNGNGSDVWNLSHNR